MPLTRPHPARRRAPSRFARREQARRGHRAPRARLRLLTRIDGYTYDDAGIRVSQDVDGAKTLFLNDANNFTGFSQVLEEWLNDGGLTLAKSYAIALDIVSQFDAAGDALHVLLYDVHGSTRALADAGGDIAQAYDYDAYGQMLNGLSPGQLLTRLLYSGEQTDATGLQYLRGRYYRISTGTFMSSDPFAGDTAVPLTLHKYLYAHGDPVNRTDPLGLFSLIETQLATSISVMFDAIEAEVAFAAQDAARGAQAGLTVQQVIQQNIAQLALFGGAALGASLVWQASFAAFNRGTNLVRANLGASRLFEAKAIAYATFTRGETVILTQFKRGAADRGFDFLSFAGRGRSARLYINEAKSVSGRVSGGTFTAFGLGAGKGMTLRENLDAAERAIRKAGLDSVTRDTLLYQLGPNGGAQIRVFGDAEKGTRFTPSVLERIGQATGFVTGVGALL